MSFFFSRNGRVFVWKTRRRARFSYGYLPGNANFWNKARIGTGESWDQAREHYHNCTDLWRIPSESPSLRVSFFHFFSSILITSAIKGLWWSQQHVRVLLWPLFGLVFGCQRWRSFGKLHFHRATKRLEVLQVPTAEGQETVDYTCRSSCSVYSIEEVRCTWKKDQHSCCFHWEAWPVPLCESVPAGKERGVPALLYDRSFRRFLIDFFHFWKINLTRDKGELIWATTSTLLGLRTNGSCLTTTKWSMWTRASFWNKTRTSSSISKQVPVTSTMKSLRRIENQKRQHPRTLIPLLLQLRILLETSKKFSYQRKNFQNSRFSCVQVILSNWRTSCSLLIYHSLFVPKKVLSICSHTFKKLQKKEEKLSVKLSEAGELILESSSYFLHNSLESFPVVPTKSHGSLFVRENKLIVFAAISAKNNLENLGTQFFDIEIKENEEPFKVPSDFSMESIEGNVVNQPKSESNNQENKSLSKNDAKAAGSKQSESNKSFDLLEKVVPDYVKQEATYAQLLKDIKHAQETGKIGKVQQARSTPQSNKPKVVEKKIKPNEKCPCGSGRKWKVCHGKEKWSQKIWNWIKQLKFHPFTFLSLLGFFKRWELHAKPPANDLY